MHELIFDKSALPKLLLLNKQGFIPGVDEGVSDFLARSDKLSDSSPNTGPTAASLRIVEKLFDIRPEWIPITYDNKGLAPWEGGATWIIEKAGDFFTHVQLRKFFSKKTTYLGIYHRDELLSHEMVHAARAGINSSKYEELIAYQTSIYPWRKFLGPLLANSFEAGCLAFSLILCMASLYAALLFPNTLSDWNLLLFGMPFLPLGLFSLGALRLFGRIKQWKACLSNIAGVIISPLKSTAVVLRLTDQEIDLFAKSNPGEIMDYAERQKELSLRWFILFHAYFIEES